MELQTRIEKLETSLNRQKIANIALMCLVVFFAVKPYGVITCDGWRVVDKDGKVRISAGTLSDGNAVPVGVEWRDEDDKVRIAAGTAADGDAGVVWNDKDGKGRISAGTWADGKAAVICMDKDGKQRIGASTFADGTVELPTSDLKPK